MDVVSFAWSRAVSFRVGAPKTMISRVPFPNCRSGVIGLAIAGNPEDAGHLSPWQEAAGHEIIPDTHKDGCANEAATGLTPGLCAMPFRTSCSADRNAGERLAAHRRQETATSMTTGT
jgi:hypothetical protein